MLRLSGIEKVEYYRKYPHIAPEVIEGERSFSSSSDMFSAGAVIFQLGDHNYFRSLSNKQQSAILDLAKLCRISQFYKRPKARNAFSCLQNI